MELRRLFQMFVLLEPNDPSNVPPLRFESGTSALVLTTSPTNQKPLPGSLLISSTESSYRTSGTVRTFLRRLVNVQGFPVTLFRQEDDS